MRRTRTTRALLAALTMSLCVACDDGSGEVVVAADASDDAAAEQDLTPIAPPALTSMLTVVQIMHFVGEDPPGITSGVNLDGLVTGDGDATGCGEADFSNPEGVPGIDNAFASVLPPLEATMSSTVNETAQEAIDTGEVLLLLALEGVDDPMNDDQVTVSLYRGAGRPMLGTDGRVLPGQSFHIDVEEPWSRDESATITDGVIRAGPFPLILSLDFFDTHVDIVMDNARVEYTLDADGGARGVIGAMSHQDTLIQMVKDLDEDFLPIAEVLLADFADMDMDGDGVCDALSLGLEITGARAHLYEDAVIPE